MKQKKYSKKIKQEDLDLIGKTVNVLGRPGGVIVCKGKILDVQYHNKNGLGFVVGNLEPQETSQPEIVVNKSQLIML